MSTGKAIGGGTLALIILIVLSIGGTALGWAWRYFTAEIKGRVDAEERIESADSRIGNYEHFFDLCATIQGNEAALQSQRAALAGAGEKEARRYRANIAGIEAQRQRNIARYNADARKAYTKARFLGNELPKRIDPRGENTTCESY